MSVGTLTDVPVNLRFLFTMARWPSQQTTHVDHGDIRPLRELPSYSESSTKRNQRRHAVLQVCFRPWFRHGPVVIQFYHASEVLQLIDLFAGSDALSVIFCVSEALIQ